MGLFLYYMQGEEKMKSVNIILCTYNGEKYLPDLLNSLLAQTYPNIRIYIRDDGSTDDTINILNEYCNRQNRFPIYFVEDKKGNLGYIKNFAETIRRSKEADYYAFCDQDDYWLPDKISNAIEQLNKKDSKKCLLYSCAYEVRDDELNFIGNGHIPTDFSKLDVGKSLSLYDGGWLLGFTLVINNELMHKAFDKKIENIYSHDIWVQAVALGFNGEFVYDNRVGAYFRRHNGSTSIAEGKVNSSLWEIWKYRFEQFKNGDVFSKIKNSYHNYYENYFDEIENNSDKCFLKIYENKNTLKKAFYPYRLKKKLTAEIAWRISALCGKL